MKKIICFFIIVICAFAASAQIQRTKPVNSKTDSATIATQVATNDVTKFTTKQNRELFKELDLSRTQMKQLKEMRKEAKIKKNDKVLIIGCGGLGLSIAGFVNTVKCDNLYLCDNI